MGRYAEHIDNEYGGPFISLWRFAEKKLGDLYFSSLKFLISKQPTWVYYKGKASCSSRNSRCGFAQKIILAVVSHNGQGLLALPETVEVTWKRPNESQAPMVERFDHLGSSSRAPARVAGPATCSQVLVFSLGNSKVRGRNSFDSFCQHICLLFNSISFVQNYCSSFLMKDTLPF